MFKKKQSSKDVNFDENLCNLKLYSLPPTLQFSSLSSINLNNNKLDQSHLAKLFENAPLLTNIDFQNNRVVCVPRAIVDLKKIRRLNLDGNPVGWPRAPHHKHAHDWKRAVLLEPAGRRVFRMYMEEKEGKVPYADLELVLMGDPMFIDKDEDRGDVKLGGKAFGELEDGVYTLPMHDCSKKNKFGDPDEAQHPWYQPELENAGERVVPVDFVSVSVMDGHGGHWVSEALKQNLFKKLHEAKLTAANLPENYEEILVQLYADLDSVILRKLKKGAGKKKDGSTCVNVTMSPGATLVSHVGDSRAVLGYTSSEMEQVTKDHDPEDEEEKKMVEARGGTCAFHQTVNGGGCHRVNGDLAMTRSFGDPGVKKVTSCIPDVAKRGNLQEIDTIVVATDGLWHHVSSEESIEIVREARDCEMAAKALYQRLDKVILAGKNKTFGLDNTMILVGKVTHGEQSVDCPKLEEGVKDR